MAHPIGILSDIPSIKEDLLELKSLLDDQDPMNMDYVFALGQFILCQCDVALIEIHLEGYIGMIEQLVIMNTNLLLIRDALPGMAP